MTHALNAAAEKGAAISLLPVELGEWIDYREAADEG